MKPTLAFTLLVAGLLSPSLQAAPVLAPLVSFTGPNGANPNGGLLQGGDGSLYGTTSFGGGGDFGTLFRLTLDGSLSNLVSFGLVNGAGPRAGLVRGADGNFFGVAYYGGADGVGTVFKLTTNHAFSVLGSFAYTNGAYPIAEMILGADGLLYGTTAIGGTEFGGAVFRVNAAGTPATLVSFVTGSTNGSSLYGRVIQTPDGNLYGTTFSGGLYDHGTVFRATTNGGFTSLYSFTGTNDGANPFAGLVQAGDGHLYGSTFYGGTNGFGTLFRLTTNGVFTSLFSFANTNGANPQAPMVVGADGGLYGTTTYGGLFTNVFGQGYGTIFKLTTNGGFTSLCSFANTNGAGPQAPLLLAGDGNFYGTTADGGASNFGVVFRLSLGSPAPTAPVFQSFTQSGGILTMTWSAVAGLTYQIQSNTNLNTTNWIGIGSSVVATNALMTTIDAIGSVSHRFYRAVLLP